MPAEAPYYEKPAIEFAYYIIYSNIAQYPLLNCNFCVILLEVNTGY